MYRIILAALAATLLLTPSAQAHHRDGGQDQRIAALESAVSALQARVKALEAPTPTPTPSPTPTPTATPSPTPTATPSATPTATPSATPTPTPTPTPSGFPDASTTGVPAGSSLTTVTGNVTISTAGAVYADRQVNGCITVNAQNVTIRRVRVVCQGASAIWSGSSGLVVEDSEIDCGTDGVGHTGLTPGNYTARRVNAHGCENIFWAERNVVVEDSYLHDPVDYDPVRDPHTDTIQIPAGGSNITIRRNTVFGNYVNSSSFGNAAITAAGVPGMSASPLVIEDNLLAGGGYTVYCPGDAPTATFNGNRFSTRYTSKIGGFGPVYFTCDDELAAGTGNVIHETGQPVTG
jgi:hypothetical protein